MVTSLRAGHRRLLVTFVGLLAMTLLLAACPEDDGDQAADADPDATDGDEGAANGDEEDGETFDLTIGSAVTPSLIVAVQALDEFFVPEVEDRVAEETPHEVTFSEHWGTVVGVGEELQAVQMGQLDVGSVIAPYHPGELAMQNAPYYLPFDSPDMELSTEAVRQLAEEVDAFGNFFPEEYNQTTLGYFGIGDYGITTTFDWDQLDELEGQSIAGVGANLEWLEPTGAVPVQQPAEEWYTSFQTGVVDGGVTFIDGITSLRLYEVSEVFTNMHFGSKPIGAINVNLDTWESLPADVQEIFEEVGREAEQRAAEIVNEAVDEATGVMEEEGMMIKEPPDEVRADWAEAVSHLPGQRAEALEEEGYPGVELMEAYIRIQEELGHEFPVDYEL